MKALVKKVNRRSRFRHAAGMALLLLQPACVAERQHATLCRLQSASETPA